MDLDASLPVVPRPRPAALSPWDDPAPIPPGVPPHWRDDPRWADAVRSPANGGESRAVYLWAMAGTMLAGGLYPTTIAVLSAIHSGRLPNRADEVLLVIFAGFFFGAIYAGLTSLFIFPLVAAVQRLTGLYRHRAVLATVAGGWTGVASVQVVALREVERSGVHPVIVLFTLVAMAMGMIGAGLAARRTVRQQEAALGGQSASPARFTLKQMLGLTAAVAVVAAILSALRLPAGTHAILGISALAQAFALVAFFGFRWASHGPTPTPSVDTWQRN